VSAVIETGSPAHVDDRAHQRRALAPGAAAGYGGIENVLATLVPELRRQGVRVVLATVGSSTIEVDERSRPSRRASSPSCSAPTTG
jgi:hypothetical protein